MRYKDGLENVRKEIAIMKNLNHKNILKLYEVIENPKFDKFFMGIGYDINITQKY